MQAESVQQAQLKPALCLTSAASFLPSLSGSHARPLVFFVNIQGTIAILSTIATRWLLESCENSFELGTVQYECVYVL